MFRSMWQVLSAMALLIAVVVFFAGFIVAPLFVLAIGYVVFAFAAPD